MSISLDLMETEKIILELIINGNRLSPKLSDLLNNSYSYSVLYVRVVPVNHVMLSFLPEAQIHQ